MRKKWVDVSIPLRPGMTVWPGDPPFEFIAQRRIATGDKCNTSLLKLSTHIGTHIDAPWHFENAGARVPAIDPELFFGIALLIDLPNVKRIDAGMLPDGPLPPRVLFKTRNSDFPDDAPFQTDFTAIEPGAAQQLVSHGVRLVGVDYLSVAPYKEPDAATHHRLLESGVLVVEGLRLRGLRGGLCTFVVLPLLIEDADGAPCRAFVSNEEEIG